MTPRECRLVDDVAAASVVSIINAVTAGELEQRNAELAATLEEIEASRRSIVLAEQRGREAMAQRLEVGLRPVFARIRAEVRAGTLDEAARSAEALIDSLRSVSTAVVEGAGQR